MKTLQQEPVLLGVVSCRTTSSLNKTLRFRYEKEGTKLFLDRDISGAYHLRKKYHPQSAPVEIRRNTYPVFHYFDVKKLVEEEGYLTIFKDGPDYLFRPSTTYEIENFARAKNKTGDVRMNQALNGICIRSEDQKRLYIAEYLSFHVVAGTKLYIECRPISEPGDLPLLKNVKTPSLGWESLGDVEEYSYYRTIPATKSLLPLPISFLRKCGVKNKDNLECYFREDGTFMIIGKPIVCDICGKEIHRYAENAYEEHICAEHKKNLPALKKIQKSKYSYTDAARLMNQIRDDLTSLLKEQ